MTPVLASIGPSAYWYLTRGTGAVALVLLTVSVVLGILGSLRFSLAPRWPRFAVDTLHRDVSLLVLAVLVVHIITGVLDSFAPIRLVDAVIPFVSTYRPLWLGLGALAFDLLIALVVTSLLRRRIGYAGWRAIHWLAYASWPVAVLHGLGTGSDTKVWWMLLLTALCVGAVLVAILVRISRAEGADQGLRGPAAALTIVAVIGLAIFTLVGPLQRGWARRAGTPARLLASAPPPAATARTVASRDSLKVPFTAPLSGSENQSPAPGGTIVDLSLRVLGHDRGTLRIRLAGAPLASGGLSLTGSQVDLLLNKGLDSVAGGKVVSLQGQEMVAHVRDSAGTGLSLHARLNIDSGSGAVTGTVHVLALGGTP